MYMSSLLLFSISLVLIFAYVWPGFAIFLGVLFVLILVHEWGHYIAAKRTGMRVDEFGIGFPPKLFGWKRGETEYTLNSMPIGGFVKIYGEDPTQVEDDPDKDRAFGARPKWAQAIVLIAGVTMNFIFAWVLIFAIQLMGVSAPVEESVATAESKLTVIQVMDEGPAANVLPKQAVITGVRSGEDTLATLTPSAFISFVGGTNGVPVSVTYELDGETATVDITPQSGVIASDPERAVLGVGLSLIETQRYGVVESIGRATTQSFQMTGAIVTGLGSLLRDTVRGTADFTQIAGPIGIVGYVGDAAAFGLTSLMMLTANISLNLVVINLLPIPALDGGRLIFVAIEAIIRRPLNAVWTSRLNLIGFAALLLLMVAVTFNDILNLL
jgi:regulator of sigma E protease